MTDWPDQTRTYVPRDITTLTLEDVVASRFERKVSWEELSPIIPTAKYSMIKKGTDTISNLGSGTSLLLEFKDPEERRLGKPDMLARAEMHGFVS